MERQLNGGRGDVLIPPRLYVVFNIPQARLGREDAAHLPQLCQRLKAVLAGGARMIQLRAKNMGTSDLLQIGAEFVPLTQQYGAQLLINTHAEVARKTGSYGVHRPAHGPAVSELRGGGGLCGGGLCGGGLRVGVSTHSLRAAIKAEKQGADFVTISPIFETASKPGYGPALGLSTLGAVCDTLSIPVYALAGVSPENAPDCLAAGAYGVAVMGGILSASDLRQATRAYVQAVSPTS